jgi:hypothetical protein
VSKLQRYRPTVTEVKATAYCGAHPQGEYVLAADHDAAIAALEADCNIMCNALQRIEAGEPEPRMVARRTLEHWSEKAALSIGKTEEMHREVRTLRT